MSDKMILKGIEVYGHHGCTIEERRLGQKFIVDVELDFDFGDAALYDDIENTVDYVKVLEIVEEVVGGEKTYNLIETLAEEIADKIQVEIDTVLDGVKVTIHKPHSPIRFKVQDVAVEIYRT